MTGADWDLVIKSMVTLLSGIVVPWAIVAYQRRTGVQVTDQQRAAVYAALTTAAGIIQTRIDQGHMAVADVTPNNPVVVAEVKAALDRVPESAAAQGTTATSAAQIVVGKVDTNR